jgi:hypothetical protein
MEIRIRDTGQLVSEREFRAMHPNTSLPKLLTEQVLNNFEADVVFEGPQASNLEWWQYSMRAGVIQINGKWYTKYIAGPEFADTPYATALEQQEQYILQKTIERNQALLSSVVQQTQQRLDDFARTRNYDGILSLCTYVTSTVTKFQIEGQYGVTGRDATWTKLYEILAEVETGVRPLPSGYADIENELPNLEWPDE